MLAGPGDVSAERDARTLIQHTVDVFGGPDILVNNGSAALNDATITNLDLADWNDTIQR